MHVRGTSGFGSQDFGISKPTSVSSSWTEYIPLEALFEATYAKKKGSSLLWGGVCIAPCCHCVSFAVQSFFLRRAFRPSEHVRQKREEEEGEKKELSFFAVFLREGISLTRRVFVLQCKWKRDLHYFFPRMILTTFPLVGRWCATRKQRSEAKTGKLSGGGV